MRSKYELKTDKELKRAGYKTDYKCRPKFTPRGYSVDYFNLFDLIAYKDGELRLIAIKGHEGVPKKLRNGISLFTPRKIIREIWIYRNNNTIRKEVIE